MIVIEEIQDIFRSLADALENEKSELSITIRTRVKTRSGHGAASNETVREPSTRERRLCFPGKTEEEAWRFSMAIATWLPPRD